jgi:hypothetical protein
MRRHPTHPRTPRKRAARIAAHLGAILASLVLAGSAQAAGEGKVNFVRDATTPFDPYITNSTSAQRQWMRDHYSRIRGYAPFFDQALSWAPPAHFYLDLYAIYTADRTDGMADRDLLAAHPDWVLKDASGNRLYIPYACSGGICPQYAADIGNPEWRAWFINLARSMMAKGYTGIHLDDVNLEMRVGNGSGQSVRPIDPRTGQPMTDADWRRYMAEFTEQVRATFPDREISHNPIWWTPHSDPSVQREIDSANYVELERGFNDQGIVGGTGTFGYQTYLAHVDWLHGRGKGVMFEPYGLDATSRIFEIASYLLVSNGRDSLMSDYQADPGNWWPGWETNLGDAAGARYSWNGLIRRDFSAGMALVNEPGATTKTVALPAGATWTDLASGDTVSSVTLGARRGAVLIKQGTTGPSDSTPPDTAIDSGPSGTITTSSTTFSFSSTESGSTFECRLDGAGWGTCPPPKAYASLANGNHSFDARAVDAVGNVDQTPASRTFTVSVAANDTTPPETTIDSGPSGTIKQTFARFSFSSSEAGSRFECRIDVSAWSACTSPKKVSGLSHGAHVFEVRAIDAAGNVDQTQAARGFTVA